MVVTINLIDFVSVEVLKAIGVRSFDSIGIIHD